MIDNDMIQQTCLAMLRDAAEALLMTGPQSGLGYRTERDRAHAWVCGEGDYVVPFDVAAIIASDCESLDLAVVRRRFLACTDGDMAARLRKARERKATVRYKSEPEHLDDIPRAGWRRVYRREGVTRIFARSSREASDWCLWGCCYVF